MDIDKLVAGRELDALLAEKVMGWKPSKDGRYWDGPDASRHREDGPWLDAGESVWSPSQDIVAAWEVLEKVQEIGSLQNFGGFGWRCEIHTTTPGYHDCAGEADTAPLAICRAALRSVL